MTSRPTQDSIQSTPNKKRRHDDENDSDSPTATKTKSPIATTTKNKHKKHGDKKQAKAELLAKIPTHDPEGIPYSKIQLRRMKRRVKNGLDPIPTEEEEREIQRRKEEEKREVEACLFGNDADEGETAKDDDGNSNAEEDEEEEDANENVEGADEEEDDGSADGGQEGRHSTKDDKPRNSQPPNKKSKRAKPVPPDYICQACQNKPSNDAEFIPHWIYDCPVKITKRGCNAVAKRLRGLHDPPSRKVFVSGLPFDVTEGTVKRFFEESVIENSSGGNAEVVHVKLIKFEDSQRCKGQGILTFDSDEGAKAALKLNGCIWSADEESGKDKKKKKDKKTEKKKDVKELRLKVSKVLNRFVTKKKKN
ncbi:hypothetical protein HJC23_006637 [Cyclotella cryptica]|uniref:RRM domain-containing protein n=1 Tax=Cyclotella cryptica TaxID=29204 RepID=A0ABD3QWV9_9STRA|eukprot:CCRYP_001059-RA/>CCRYP_001059-RA protein AED:0.17 eAED:0.17 QI:0/-1/0/1/-1/1/1/0/363